MRADGWIEGAAVSIVLLLACVFRVVGLEAEPVWFDEVMSLNLSEGQVLEWNAELSHAPLHYVSLAGWRHLFGDDIRAARMHCVAWSLIGLFAAYLWLRGVNKQMAILALILLALSPLDIHYAREAQKYSQTAAFLTLSSGILWAWMAGKGRPAIWAILYALTALGALATHFVAAFVLLAQGLFALGVFGRRRNWRSVSLYLCSAVLVAIGFLPWCLMIWKYKSGLYDAHLFGWMHQPRITDPLFALGRELPWGFSFVGHDWLFGGIL